MEIFETFEPHWIWITLGLVLAALEILVPGVYLIWLALAAIVTGVLTFAVGISLPLQVVIFTVLSLIAAYSAKRWLRDSPIESSDPLLNQRGGRLVGQTAIVCAALDSGTGRIKHGDSEWLASGPDLPVGTKVRIIGSEGVVLQVEPLPVVAGQANMTAPEAGGSGGETA